MAMKVRYTVMNGQVLSENRNGVKCDYISDSLASTIALVDNTQTITDTFKYWPYGEVRARTGATATPFQFVGALGCYRDSADQILARARVLQPSVGRWTAPDPTGVRASDCNLYRYAMNRPMSLTDPTGLFPVPIFVWPGRPVWPGDKRFPKPKHGGWMPALDSACVAAAYKITKEVWEKRYKGRPGAVKGGPGDAFRHCLGACLVRQLCGAYGYNNWIEGHERDESWWCKGDWNPTYSPMDNANNELGRKCAGVRKMDCATCCEYMVLGNLEYTLPPWFWE